MKTTPFTLDDLHAIIKDHPTPFHIYDEAGIRQAARALNAAFAWNEGFKEYYAVKACPNPHLLDILMAEGCGLDCSSFTELMLAQGCGAHADQIMFSANNMPAEEFRYARSLDALINLDDFSHIEFLEKNGGIPDTICCRYNPGGTFQLGNMVMGNPGDAKYGMTRPQLTEAFKRLKALGAKHFGLHAFWASNTTDTSYYPGLARDLFKLAVELRDETGISIEFVNLSGGVGIAYHPDEPKPDIMAIGEGVRRAYVDVLTAANFGPVRIKTELGRWMTGPYGYLVTTAVHYKNIHKAYIGVDASAANLMRPAMYGSYHHITVMGKENAPHDHTYDIVGSLCENNDKFAIDRELPKIENGDILAIHDTGAHGFAMGYNYNGKLRSAELLLKADKSVTLIRRAETPTDYFATLSHPGLAAVKPFKG